MDFIEPLHLSANVLTKHYNYYLVTLSVIIAVLASYTAFGIAERVRASVTNTYKLLWIMLGSISMGIGVWSTHFIGILALSLPLPINYDPNLTMLSVTPALLMSGIVYWLLSQHHKPSTQKLIASGLLLVLGIIAMYHIGMLAIRLQANIAYLKATLSFSIIIGFLLATTALKINFNFIKNYPIVSPKRQFISAVILGVAVSSMHYIAMLATVFTSNDSKLSTGTDINSSVLSPIIAIITFLLFSIALILPTLFRQKEMMQQLKLNENALKVSATVFQAHEAIMLIDSHRKILHVNQAFSDSMGYTDTDLSGAPVSFVYDKQQHDNSFYESYWDDIKQHGKWSGEFWNRKKNGDTFATRHTITAVSDEQNKVTHYVVFFSDITNEKLADKQVEQLAYFDPLTEMPNRRLLHQRLEHELSIAKRYHRIGVLLFLDLDRFKNINDSLGHSIGDDLLIQTAVRLQSLLRETDTAGRLGGDEFVILISAQDDSQAKALNTARNIAKKITQTINIPYSIGKHELNISTSIGITLFNGIDATGEELIQKADTAMYQAKAAGRNTYCFYEQSMQESVDIRMLTETCLRTAIKNSELFLLFQPQVNNKKIIGAEALLRWRSPDLGNVALADFMPVAEETGLIKPIGQWVIETACDQINQLDELGLSIPTISINISAKQFLQNDFISTLIDTTEQKKVKPNRLMLEITEAAFLNHVEEAIERMNALKLNGFKLSIDDFGTGFSSLSFLKQLPFDQLKVDQVFTQGISIHQSDIAIVKAISTIADGMGLQLMVEGVETQKQIDILTNYGCDNYQGFFVSKPLPSEQFIHYLQQTIEHSA